MQNHNKAQRSRFFIDFTNRLAATWRQATQRVTPPQPKKADEMYTILRRLIATPTITGNHEANHDALDYIAAFLKRRNLYIERLEFNGVESLVATTRHTKTPRIMLAAHLDVVTAPPAAFELREQDGKLYGRGVLDMKFAVAAYLQVLDELPGELSDYDLGIMITTDEEAGGSDGVQPLLEAGYVPKVCILPDGGDNWQIQVSAKGFTGIKLQSTGKTAHGSRPWLGDNAIMKLEAAIVDIKQFFADQNEHTSTLNVGLISGGQAINQVPDYAEASLDIRVISETDRTAILAKIEEICARHQISFSLIWSGAICKFDLNNPYIQPFARQIERVTGVHVTGSHALGGSDARFFMKYDVPCISFYPTGGGHHGPNEWLDKQALYQFKDVLAAYIQDLHSS